MVRVVFFGNSASGFTARHFEALLATPAELVGLVDVPPSQRSTTNPRQDGHNSIAGEARRRDIPLFEPQRTDEGGFVVDIQSLEPDLFVAAGYALLLRAPLLALPSLMAVNFHASLLPDYRGKHPIFWALRNGERWVGLSVHVMDRGIDTGDLIYQVKIQTRQDDSVASLYERIMERSVPLVERLILDAALGTISRIPQPEGSGSYYSSTTEEDFRLVWNWPAGLIRRYITVTPGKCYLQMGEGRLYIIDAKVDSDSTAHLPGTILRINRSRTIVAARDGEVSLGMVRDINGQVQSASAYFRNRGLTPGAMLTG